MNIENNILNWRPSPFGRAALLYATRWRLRVLPLLVESREPHLLAVPHGSEDASNDIASIQAWWTVAPKCNVGIACAQSDLLVIQVDPVVGGRETMARLALALGPLPLTWHARTSIGIDQYYFRHVGPCDDWIQLGPGVQLRHSGHTVAPPSIGPDGGRYRWEHHPLRTRLARLPPAWRGRLASGTGRPVGEWNLDARESFLGIAFQAAGWLGDLLPGGRRTVRCPWRDQHSVAHGQFAEGTDSSVAVLGPAPVGSHLGRFRCTHPCCRDREVVDVMRMLPSLAIEAAADTFPTTYERLVGRLGAGAVPEPFGMRTGRGSA